MADAAGPVERFRVARFDRCRMSRQKLRKKLQRDERAPAFEIFSVESTPLLRQLVLPLPDQLRRFVPADFLAARDRIVKRWQWNILYGGQYTEFDGFNETHRIRSRSQPAGRANFGVSIKAEPHRKSEIVHSSELGNAK